MKETEEKLTNMHVGRLIHMMSHQMKRDSNSVASAIENDELTIMQKHVLKFVLLESLHRDLYQKDIEKHGYIYRESVKRDARLKRIVPTAKAEEMRPKILEHIQKTEARLIEGIAPEDVLICKKALGQMLCNLSEMNKEENQKDE